MSKPTNCTIKTHHNYGCKIALSITQMVPVIIDFQQKSREGTTAKNQRHLASQNVGLQGHKIYLANARTHTHKHTHRRTCDLSTKLFLICKMTPPHYPLKDTQVFETFQIVTNQSKHIEHSKSST